MLPTGPIIIEAEHLRLDTGRNPFVISTTPLASAGALVLLPRSGDQGILSGSFNESFAAEDNTSYTIEIAFFDETDGQSSFEFTLNDITIQTFTADSQDGAAGATGSRTSIIIEDVTINQGDTFALLAARDGGEPARVDNFTFTQTPAPQTSTDIIGTSRNDRLEGSEDNDTIRGLEGNDRLVGRGGDDVLFGDDGNDTLFGFIGDDQLFGGAGRDRLFARGGDDILNGGAGRDRLDGGDGNDILIGGEGNDTLYGGRGADIFVFDQIARSDDRIRDFTLNGPDADRLDISNILSGFEQDIDNISDFIAIEFRNNNRADLKFNEDGQGNDFTRIAVINGSDFRDITAEDLLASAQLIL